MRLLKNIRIILIILILLLAESCSWQFQACIRNKSSSAALIDVYLLHTQDMKTLPNKIRMANQIINLKKGYKRFLDSTQNVTWIDLFHFKVNVKPGTTVDLTDMACIFINGSPRCKVILTVSSGNKTDTILNTTHFPYTRQLNYEGGFFKHILYYDITD